MAEAFSAGLGMAMGLIVGQYMLQTTKPRVKVEVKRVVICQACSFQNPVENRFCSNCGQRLYFPRVKCRNCGSMMPAAMKFCGDCGQALPG